MALVYNEAYSYSGLGASLRWARERPVADSGKGLARKGVGMAQPGPRNLITDVEGLLVGQAHDERLRSGVTVILPQGARAGGGRCARRRAGGARGPDA